MIFSFKRVVKDFAYLILLAFTIFAPILAFKAGESIKVPPFGYVMNDNATRLSSELDDAGWVRCETEDELKEEIMDHHLDCGIVFADDISSRIETGELDESVKLITSPETLMSELCRISAVSCVSMVYSPYVTYNSLRGEVDLETVKDTYYSMVDSGKLFGFDIESASGSQRINDARSRNLFKGTLAIFIFIACFIAIARPVWRHYNDMLERLGKLRAITRVLIPEYVVRFIMLIAASTITCLIMGQFDVIIPAILLTLICGAAGLAAIIILPESAVIVITVFVTILSLGLTPIFTDLSEVLPVARILRLILLPYLIWIL